MKKGFDIRVKTTALVSIRKTGIALWRGSGFSFQMLKNKNDIFYPMLFFDVRLRKMRIPFSNFITRVL